MTKHLSVDELLAHTNLNSGVWPWNGVAHGIRKRWHGPIPVKTNGIARADAALDRIENALGRAIFDRQSIANTADHQITRGIVVSVNTAVAPQMNEFTCGNVGDAPGSYHYPAQFVNSLTGEISARLYVNLGSPLCDDSKKGEADSDIAVHEFAHAMGLGPHFWGFGDDRIISDRFWKVLVQLYSD